MVYIVCPRSESVDMARGHQPSLALTNMQLHLFNVYASSSRSSRENCTVRVRFQLSLVGSKSCGMMGDEMFINFNRLPYFSV